MGKSAYNFGKTSKEKARQQKQMAKTSKRMIARQYKANFKLNTPNEKSDAAEPDSVDDTAKA